MPTLGDNTVVRHPQTRQPAVLTKGDRLPDWAVGLVGDHLLVADGDPVEQPEEASGGAPVSDGADPETEPPRAGAGSGRAAWAAFASAHGVEVDDDTGRDAIIAELEQRGLISGS